MNLDSAHKNRWKIAEVVFGIPFLLSIPIHFFVPLSLQPGLLKQIVVPIGVISIILGVGIFVLGRRELARYGQPTDPGHPTNAVVQTGIFAISRNPLYLSCVIVLSGIALTLNMLWIFVTLLASIILCHYILIIPEERYLSARFGEDYEKYSATVQRWLGRK